MCVERKKVAGLQKWRFSGFFLEFSLALWLPTCARRKMGWFWSGAATQVKAGKGHGFGRQCRWLGALQGAGRCAVKGGGRREVWLVRLRLPHGGMGAELECAAGAGLVRG